MKYRKKPVVIDAVKWTGENFDEITRFATLSRVELSDGLLHIITLEGMMVADEGDFIIKGVKGEYYPCKPDIFEKTYEKVV